jgi:hypothetical protein
MSVPLGLKAAETLIDAKPAHARIWQEYSAARFVMDVPKKSNHDCFLFSQRKMPDADEPIPAGNFGLVKVPERGCCDVTTFCGRSGARPE